jgi:hypothetical protein
MVNAWLCGKRRTVLRIKRHPSHSARISSSRTLPLSSYRPSHSPACIHKHLYYGSIPPLNPTPQSHPSIPPLVVFSRHWHNFPPCELTATLHALAQPSHLTRHPSSTQPPTYTCVPYFCLYNMFIHPFMPFLFRCSLSTLFHFLLNKSKIKSLSHILSSSARSIKFHRYSYQNKS